MTSGTKSTWANGLHWRHVHSIKLGLISSYGEIISLSKTIDNRNQMIRDQKTTILTLKKQQTNLKYLLKSELQETLFADGYHLDKLFLGEEPMVYPSSDVIPFAKRIEMIIYDYDAIKKHNNELHTDLKYIYRYFERLLRIRYDTPMAIAIPQK